MSLRYIFSGLVWMVFGLAMALSKSAQAQGLDEGASFSVAGTGSLILNSGSISDIAPVGIEGFSGGSLSLSSYGDYSGWTSIINGTTFGGTLEVTGGTINNTGNRLTISGSNVTLTYNPTNLSSDNVFSGLVTGGTTTGGTLQISSGFLLSSVNTVGTLTDPDMEALTFTSLPSSSSLLLLNLPDSNLQVVPEPSTWALFIGGLGLLAILVRSKRARDAQVKIVRFSHT